jgi:hypothetical protein
VSRTAAFLLAVAISASACADSGGPSEPEPSVTANMTVDASAGWAYVDFAGTSGVAMSVRTASDSAKWDIGFNATSVTVNGGSNGPGDVAAYCICQNAGATSNQIMAFTASSELADFESVTAAQIPSSSTSWSADVFNSSKWYRYNLTGSDHQVWPTFDVYLVKRGTDVYKVQLTNYYGPGGEPRRISFRYAKLR